MTHLSLLVLSATFKYNTYAGNESETLSICVLLSHIPSMTVIIPLSTTNPGHGLHSAESMFFNCTYIEVCVVDALHL